MGPADQGRRDEGTGVRRSGLRHRGHAEGAAGHAVRRHPRSMASGWSGQELQTWNSDTWPAGQPVLAVTVTRK